jgi:hypothetical protein
MIKKIVFIAVLFFINLSGFCQGNSDFQSRFNTSVDYKLNKKWKFYAEYRYSLENDLQKFRSSSIQLESKYAITKKLTLTGGYRFTTSFEEDNHRFFASLNYDYKLNKSFTVALSSKYQYATNSFDPDFINEFKQPVEMFRQKIGLELNVPKSKFSFNTGTEFFLKTNSQPYFKFNRTRYMLGSDYNFKKYGKFGITIFYDDKYNPIKNDRIVLITKYAFSINDFLKKSKK